MPWLAVAEFERVDGAVGARRARGRRWPGSSTASPSPAGTTVEVVLDPANPDSVATAFGDRSVLELPGYEPPWWLPRAREARAGWSPSLAGETADEVPGHGLEPGWTSPTTTRCRCCSSTTVAEYDRSPR